MIKKIIAFALIFSVSSTIVKADVLGNKTGESASLEIGHGTELINNTYLSEQEGVGYQREYYAKYTPNKNVRPVVITGETIWGKRTINEAIEYMRGKNLYPMIGINASFFSFQTGLPMGHVITNGEITSKDSSVLDSVAFKKDGTAFISKLGIKTTAYFDEYEFDIPHINKFVQETSSAVTLFDDNFDSKTNALGETMNIVLGEIEGKLSIGESVKGVVEDIITTNEPIEIPEGKMVLTLSMVSGNEWAKTLFPLIEIGMELVIKNEAIEEPDKWKDAYNAIGSEGKRLLVNGNVADGLTDSANPRTAVGIMEDGTVIFYVLDGRQTGYSYGAREITLANRLLEMGCVDALNLDGGGSTSISGIYPGQDIVSVINSPSGGTLRKVSNFIFLENLNEPTNELDKLYIYPYSEHYLVGSEVDLSVSATDTEYHIMPAPEVEFSSDVKWADISNDGVLTLNGNGKATITARTGKIEKKVDFYSYDTPDIKVKNKSTGKYIKTIEGKPNEEFSLKAEAYFNDIELIYNDEQFVWEITDELGTVENGVLKLNDVEDVEGELKIRAGNSETIIPISIPTQIKPLELYPYSEIEISNNCLNVKIKSYNDKLDFQNCKISIDGEIFPYGKYITTQEDTLQEIVIPMDEKFFNEFHKISVKSVLENKNESINYLFIKNDIEDLIFDDMGEHWSKNLVAFMGQNKIVNGNIVDELTMFYPDNNMTRVEFSVMICNYLKLNIEEYKDVELEFDDLDIIPNWALGYVKAASEIGIISGKMDGDKVYFAPSDEITRAEAVTIIARTLSENLRIGELGFDDDKEIPKWAEENFRVMTNSKFISGYPDNTIRPNNKVTRAEAVVLLGNVY